MRRASAAPLELRAGAELAGYRIGKVVGRGGMGVVYEAEHVHLQRTVALKVLLPELAADKAFQERFVREARTAAAIKHPNVVTVYDAGEADALLYIAMQFVDGTDLASLLSERGALEPDEALGIVGQVAEALDAAHAVGVVHRDVKPGNVLLGSGHAYLTDFGLTRLMTAKTALTQDGQVVGTIDYMSPEQIEGKAVDARADVYSLGCVLYECLSGAVPFDRDSQVSMMYAHLQDPPPSVSAARSGLPGALDDVIARAMAKRPADRYDTCGELVAAARAAVELGESPPARARRSGTIVIAANDPAARSLAHLSLEGQAFRVVEAANGREVLAAAVQERPDVVLVDSGLADTTPAELGAALRRAPETAHTKVVLLTGRGEGSRLAREAGADARLPVPFSSLQLLNTIADLLGDEAAPSTNAGGPPAAGAPAEPATPVPAHGASPVRRSSVIQRAVLQRSVRRATLLGVAAVLIAAGGVAAFAAGAFSSSDQSAAVERVVRAAGPATLPVESLDQGVPVESGTGWVLDGGRGLVVTNAHVVNDGTAFQVDVRGVPRRADIVGVAPCDDLAVLHVRGGGLPTLPLGSQSRLALGETVVALGYPANASLQDDLTSTTGVVSVVRSSYHEPAPDVPRYPDVIQTDAAINPGSSGGPLLDLDGRVVGVVSAGRTLGPDGRIIQGQGYAIGVDRVKTIVATLRQHRSIGWTGAGFTYRAAPQAGLVAGPAVPGTPAARSGLQPGARILSVNGMPVASLAGYCDAVAGLESGRPVEFRVLQSRASAPTTLTVPLQ